MAVVERWPLGEVCLFWTFHPKVKNLKKNYCARPKKCGFLYAGVYCLLRIKRLVCLLSLVPSKPPQNLTVAKDNSTSTSLFIHWRPVPANHQNGIILGYRIMYKKSASEDTLKTKNVSARTTATELKNLTKFTEYSITILAYTSKGNGVRAKFFTASTTEDRKYLISVPRSRFCHATWRDETKTAERETKVSHERSKKCIKRKILPDIFCLFLGGDAK